MCTPLCAERLKIKSRLRDCKYPQRARSRGPRIRSRREKDHDDRERLALAVPARFASSKIGLVINIGQRTIERGERIIPSRPSAPSRTFLIQSGEPCVNSANICKSRSINSTGFYNIGLIPSPKSG
jgi:hypothetical protein